MSWRDSRTSAAPYSAPPASAAATAAASRAAAATAPYIVVEGCPPHLGCTVLLRGHPDDVLAAKRVLRYAVYVAVRGGGGSASASSL